MSGSTLDRLIFVNLQINSILIPYEAWCIFLMLHVMLSSNILKYQRISQLKRIISDLSFFLSILKGFVRSNFWYFYLWFLKCAFFIQANIFKLILEKCNIFHIIDQITVSTEPLRIGYCHCMEGQWNYTYSPFRQMLHVMLSSDILKYQRISQLNRIISDLSFF